MLRDVVDGLKGGVMPEEHKVVPFIGKISGGKFDERSAGQVAEQLEGVIRQNSTDGWEFFRIDQVQIQVAPGCLGAIFGQKVAYLSFDQVIFRRGT